MLPTAPLARQGAAALPRTCWALHSPHCQPVGLSSESCLAVCNTPASNKSRHPTRPQPISRGRPHASTTTSLTPTHARWRQASSRRERCPQRTGAHRHASAAARAPPARVNTRARLQPAARQTRRERPGRHQLACASRLPASTPVLACTTRQRVSQLDALRSRRRAGSCAGRPAGRP